MFSKLSKLLDSFLEQGIPGYDCVIYHKGQEVFRQYGGFSSLEEKKPTDGTERYFIYSCSKPITAAAGMMCLERGLFKLDDAVSMYLPEFSHMTVRDGDTVRPAERAITVKDLFCMTAGFGYDCGTPELEKCKTELKGSATTRQMMAYLAKEPLLFEPGAKWEYSFCHDVLVALIEVVTGERFDSFAEKNIFAPLGMKASTYRVPENRDRIAEQYVYDPETKEIKNAGKEILDFSSFGAGYESGGAGCVSSAEDCIRFLEALRSGERLLKRETVKQMTTNQLTPEQMQSYWMQGYGYGLGVKCPIGVENCCDFGWGGLAGALMSVDVDNELSIFYVQHIIGAQNDIGRYMIPGLAREALGLDTKPVRSTMDGLNKYV